MSFTLTEGSSEQEGRDCISFDPMDMGSSFGYSSLDEFIKHQELGIDCSASSGQGTKRANPEGRGPSYAYEHCRLERKRREKISQRLIALSALVPGLTKMDKASILGECIKYLKELQEREKFLEEQAKNKIEESATFRENSQGGPSNGSSSSSGNSYDSFANSLDEIQVTFSGKDVLIRLNVKKKRGVLEGMLREIQKLHLNVVNSNILSFASHLMEITIIAQMDAEFSLSANALMRNLQSRLL